MSVADTSGSEITVAPAEPGDVDETISFTVAAPTRR